MTNTWWADDLTPTPGIDPWTSVFPYQPWMRELHRPGQEVVFVTSKDTNIGDWQPTARVFTLNFVCGTAKYLDIRRDGEVTRIELDKMIAFSGGEFHSTWTGSR